MLYSLCSQEWKPRKIFLFMTHGKKLTLFIQLDTYSSSAISHCLFSLAHSPVVQDRLYKEITETLKNTDGSDTFEAIITKMPLLEATLKETLRYVKQMMIKTDSFSLDSILQYLQTVDFVELTIIVWVISLLTKITSLVCTFAGEC